MTLFRMKFRCVWKRRKHIYIFSIKKIESSFKFLYNKFSSLKFLTHTIIKITNKFSLLLICDPNKINLVIFSFLFPFFYFITWTFHDLMCMFNLIIPPGSISFVEVSVRKKRSTKGRKKILFKKFRSTPTHSACWMTWHNIMSS